MDRLRPKLQYITEGGGSQIKERWCKKVRLNQTNKSGKKNKWRILKAASYQTVLEEGFRRCPWVTVQRWRARRLCCQSKARGRWVLGRTVERKWEKKKKVYITRLSNPGEHTPFSKPWITEALLLLFLFVSATCTETQKTHLSIPCWDATTDLQAQIAHPSNLQNPQLSTISWQCRMCAALAMSGYQAKTPEWRFGSAVRSGRCRPSDSLIPISPFYQRLIHMWGMSPPPPPCKHCLDLLLMLASYNIYSFTSTEDMDMENATILPAYR